MRVFYHVFKKGIFIYCLLISLSCNNSERNVTNILKSNFSESEILELKSIVDNFESNLLKLYPENTIFESYKSFSKLMLEHINNNKDISLLYSLSMINREMICNYNVSNEIWIFDKNSKDNFTILNLNYEGSYLRFLNDLSKSNNFILEYISTLKNTEDLYSSIVLNGFSKGYNYLNFKDINIRIVFAVHYLSVYY